MIIQNEDLKEAILDIIVDSSFYLENLRILIDVPKNEEISDRMLSSTIRSLKQSLDYLSKILTQDIE